MKKLIPVLVFAYLHLISCSENHSKKETSSFTIGYGQMPAITASANSVAIVFGKGDSLMFTTSASRVDSFSPAALIDTLPNVVAYATRGPQICLTSNGFAVIAVNKAGDIFSYTSDNTRHWTKGNKLNNVDTVDKEGFLGLAGNGSNKIFAIWTDLRNDRHNKLYGARSTDGGKTWQENILVYASPDGNICECCKPSVVMQNDNVYVMFRNWIKGNRDLYLVQSANGGASFGKAIKLGSGSWHLDGCPMDGGSLDVNKDSHPQTVWRRGSAIYTCEPGQTEKQIGEGKNCVITTVDNKNIYAWTRNGKVLCTVPGSPAKVIGEGDLPVLKSINDKEAICIWQNNKHIQGRILHL